MNKSKTKIACHNKTRLNTLEQVFACVNSNTGVKVTTSRDWQTIREDIEAAFYELTCSQEIE